MAASGSDDLNDTANSNTSKQMGYASPMTAKDRTDLEKETKRIEKEDIKLNPAPKSPVAVKIPKAPVEVPKKILGSSNSPALNKKSSLNSIAQFNKLALDPASSAKPKDDPNFNPYAKMKGPTEGFGKAPKSKDTDPKMNQSPKFKDTDPEMNKSPKFPNTGV